MIRFVPLVMSLALAIALPTSARAQSGGAQVGPNATAALTPKLLGDALSCRSRDAVEAFAEALFLDQQPPAWMHEAKDDKDTEGMLGLYGYTLAKPTSLLGQRVERVYFMNDWIVTLWPRKMAEAFVTAHAMKRAPIAVTEQYYSFIDHESGPMLGAFAPTGNAIAAMDGQSVRRKSPAFTARRQAVRRMQLYAGIRGGISRSRAPFDRDGGGREPRRRASHRPTKLVTSKSPDRAVRSANAGS